MAKIYIAKENLKKLEDTEAAKLLEGFNPNRPEKKVVRKKKEPIPSVILKNRERRAKEAKKKARREIEEWCRQNESAAEKQKKKQEARAKAKRKAYVRIVGRNKAEQKRLKQVRIVSEKLRGRSTMVALGGTGVNLNKMSVSSKRRKTVSKPLTRNVDSNDLAGLEAARNVPTGGYRKKSREWNALESRKLRGSLKRARWIRRRDPNTDDRQAVK